MLLRISILRWAMLACFLLTAFISLPGYARQKSQVTYSAIYVFGDSYCDVGISMPPRWG